MKDTEQAETNLEPVEELEEPTPSSVKKRGKPQTKEFMASIARKGGEINKMKGAVKRFEKEQQRKELEQKFTMIQAEMERQKNGPVQPVEQAPAPKRKPKKIIEVVHDDVSDEDDTDEEEVVIKRIIKKKPAKQTKPTTDDIIERSNIEMLRNKLQEDVRKRLMSSLFDC